MVYTCIQLANGIGSIRSINADVGESQANAVTRAEVAADASDLFLETSLLKCLREACVELPADLRSEAMGVFFILSS